MTDKSENPGVLFEKMVFQLQQRLDLKATVTHSEKLVDWLGQKRQFDVLIRGEAGGDPFLGVIECKDWSRPVGSKEVDLTAL